MRISNRAANQLRSAVIEPNILKNAEGSCLIKLGNTEVICSASLSGPLPRWLKNSGQGWLTAEYSMLPRSTNERMRRENNLASVGGRTIEIQRLISRSLRAAVDLKLLKDQQIIIDCDVINADGGTRCAAITGGYVALHLAIRHLMQRKLLSKNPLLYQIAAVSCGIYQGQAILDLDYAEDSNAEVDANFIFNQQGQLIEVQATAEQRHFSPEQLQQMLALAQEGANKLFILQNKILLNL